MQDLIYLSVDLDYWKQFPTAFLKKIVSLRVPTAVSIEHHKLLPHINRYSQCTKIINVDTHADICGNIPKGEIVNCGTWANFVRWGNKLSYTWSYPDKKCARGRTNNDGCWSDIIPEDNPFFSKTPKKLCGWSQVSRRINPLVKDSEWASIFAVGICVSPAFLETDEQVVDWTTSLLDMANVNGFERYDSKKTWKDTMTPAGWRRG